MRLTVVAWLLAQDNRAGAWAPVPSALAPRRVGLSLGEEVSHRGQFVTTWNPRNNKKQDRRRRATLAPSETGKKSGPSRTEDHPSAEKRELMREKELRAAYARCAEITKIFSKTFYFGTTFFSAPKQTAVHAIYVWCRRTDDIVDSPLATMLGPERMAADLDKWEERLERIWKNEPTDSLDLALADTKVRYPDLDMQPYRDMIKGMLMDTPGHPLYANRYETWEDLELYCYRVAGTVGLMTLPVLGCSPGYTLRDAKEPALSLGVAFQITNILRDVGEDAIRGRIYLPAEDLRKFGVTEQQIFDGLVDDKYKALIDFEIQRANKYYALAAKGIPMLSPEARLAVSSSLRVYKGILDKIVKNDYDNFRKRAFVSKLEKFAMMPAAWLDVQDDLPFGLGGAALLQQSGEDDVPR